MPVRMPRRSAALVLGLALLSTAGLAGCSSHSDAMPGVVAESLPAGVTAAAG